MADCHLTDKQKELLRSIVPGLKDGSTKSEWIVPSGGEKIRGIHGLSSDGRLWRNVWDGVVFADFDDFVECGLLRLTGRGSAHRNYSLYKQRIFDIVESNFGDNPPQAIASRNGIANPGEAIRIFEELAQQFNAQSYQPAAAEKFFTIIHHLERLRAAIKTTFGADNPYLADLAQIKFVYYKVKKHNAMTYFERDKRRILAIINRIFDELRVAYPGVVSNSKAATPFPPEIPDSLGKFKRDYLDPKEGIRIFVSYSSKTRKVVERLIDDFKSVGYNVWYDQQLVGGQEWWDNILGQIRSCDLFVLALSQDWLNSKACWDEFTYASVLKRNLLPVLVSDVEDFRNIPVSIQRLQVVEYRVRRVQSVLKLWAALNSQPITIPLPDPLPEPPELPISVVSELVELLRREPFSLDIQTKIIERANIVVAESTLKPKLLPLLVELRHRTDLHDSILPQLEALIGKSMLPSYFLKQLTPRQRELVDAMLNHPSASYSELGHILGVPSVAIVERLNEIYRRFPDIFRRNVRENRAILIDLLRENETS